MAELKYIHPSVTSQITDNSAYYVTATGSTRLFCVFTSEKGVDNEIKLITSVSEFEFLYGEPNMKLYGQAGYNVANWLNAGGVAYCLRVLPEDAGFAHAIVNIQTKVVKGGKQVLDANDNLVSMDNVFVRPVITYTSTNNTSKEALENELNRKDKTVDGYENHPLFAVIPKGRGKGYNDLGFKIALNTSYDSTYDFRLYDFSVTQTSDAGVTSIVDGPFLVSFDSEAISNSGANLFIKDVLNAYCNYFTVIFNEDAFDEIGEIINPEVNPNKIDFFNGITKLIDYEAETYYEPITGKDEDIHIRLNTYSIDGNPTGSKNIADADDTIEQAIVDYDNSNRENVYNMASEAYERMKIALSCLKNFQKNNGQGANPLAAKVTDTLSKLIDSGVLAELDPSGTSGIVFDNVEHEAIDTETYVESYNTLTTAVEKLTEDENQVSVDSGVRYYNFANDQVSLTDDYTDAKKAYSVLKTNIETLINDVNYIYDFTRIKFADVDSIDAQVYLNEIKTYLSIIDTYTVKYSKYINDITDLVSEKAEVIETNSDEEKISLIYESISVLSDIISNLKTVQVDEEIKSIDSKFAKVVDEAADFKSNLVIADGPIQSTENILNELSNCYEDLTNEYTVSEDYAIAMRTAMNLLEDLYSEGKFAIRLTLLERQYFTYYLINNTLVLQDKIPYLEGEDEYNDITGVSIYAIAGLAVNICQNLNNLNKKTAENQITLFINGELNDALKNTYLNQIQNFDKNVNLLFGTDGEIEGASVNSSAVERLLVKGYKGIIDERLTDKEVFPIDLVLDANYPIAVKNAIITLVEQIRPDFVAVLDTKFQGTPSQAITFRRNSISTTSYRVAIFTQDLVVNDSEYTGLNIQVTPTYFLASKIPVNDDSFGIHWNFVGPRRGTINGFLADSLSFLPNPEWKEQLYKAQVNYIEQDQNSTRFGSQNTAQTVLTSLSNFSNVRALLRIQRDVESLMKKYIFEYNDDTTINAAQSDLDNYLAEWTANRACDFISGEVYASEYDRLQKVLRVKIELVFNSIIERIAIDIVVNS